ncbi:DUF2911 domain-containing protein [Costertonia aggregata]|uniref:DUF2911 domain-containing protein n=1 Tax=Costertonia aggregata TaxID=343403 RepID=A0A7H9ARU9_9FLAO|nr:DUF2911 domain-containing protein [Costertonia aggregata]QLG46174.1 DUF2911 domain-containing protein [Costertonia aggregata]
MKKLLTISTFILALTFTTGVSAQDFSDLDKSPMDAASYPSSYKESDKKVRIIYGRPQLKGRTVSSLAKEGEVWRTGANEAPEITFYQDVNFGGEDVKAGTYALLTIPGEKEWTVILHNKLNEWGSYFYKEANDVARVKAGASTDSKSLEAFSIAFKEVEDGVHMVMGWGTTRVAVPITM